MPINMPISREDLLRSKKVTPGWYLAVVKSAILGPGKNDPSSNTITFELVIKDGTNKEFIGVPIPFWVSEKAVGMGTPFLEAVTGKKLPDDGANPDWELCVGREVKVYIKNDTWNGRATNKCEDFAPAISSK